MDDAERQLATPLERLLDLVEGALPVRKTGDAEEREVKVLGVDLEKLHARLAELPNVASFAGTVRTWKIEGHDDDTMPVRVRVMGDTPVRLDVKGPVVPHPTYKVRREVNFTLLDDIAPEEIAQRLGGIITEYVEKERASYDVTDGDLHFHLDIDQDPDLGLLVEIEGATDAAIERAIVLLRLEGYETTPASRGELLRLRAQAGAA